MADADGSLEGSPAGGNENNEKSQLTPEESRRGVPRLREIMRRQRRDSDVRFVLYQKAYLSYN